MATPKTRLLLLIAVPALIFLLPLTIYFIDSAAASDKVARNVSISGVDVARYTEAEAIAAVNAYTADLLANTVTIEVNGESFSLTPQEVNLTFDTEGAVTAAMAQYKNGVTEWFQAFSDEVDLPVTATLDADLLDEKFTEWQQAAIPNPAFEGSVRMVGQSAERRYPKEGTAIDRDPATLLIRDALISGATNTVVLPTAISTPVHTTADIDAAGDRAETIVARGVVLTNDEYDFTFLVPPPDLANALEVRVPTDGRVLPRPVGHHTSDRGSETTARGPARRCELEHRPRG